MAAQGLQQEGILRLHGRDPECAAIDRLLEDARAGIGGALVVAPTSDHDRGGKRTGARVSGWVTEIDSSKTTLDEAPTGCEGEAMTVDVP